VSKSVLGIVPARLASTRLPNKPLYPILGRPLIEWVWRRVSELGTLDHAVVATDSYEVAELCRALGAPVEMTSPDHPSGTDRVAEVAARDEYRGFDVIANIQGDEPLLQERQLSEAVRLVQDEGWDVGTCATPLVHEEARKDPAIVKVARAANGRALYFSRAQIPYKRGDKPTRDELGREPFLRHIGIYAYTRDALSAWVALSPSPLERLEKLEQLRPLEAGLRIGVAVVGTADPGVDTPADVLRVEERLIEMGYARGRDPSGDEPSDISSDASSENASANPGAIPFVTQGR
jgi:3-deoxy-manno-octulosonate cytidylyltransferase (CMP-KDO synthetase)